MIYSREVSVKWQPGESSTWQMSRGRWCNGCDAAELTCNRWDTRVAMILTSSAAFHNTYHWIWSHRNILQLHSIESSDLVTHLDECPTYKFPICPLTTGSFQRTDEPHKVFIYFHCRQHRKDTNISTGIELLARVNEQIKHVYLFTYFSSSSSCDLFCFASLLGPLTLCFVVLFRWFSLFLFSLAIIVFLFFPARH